MLAELLDSEQSDDEYDAGELEEPEEDEPAEPQIPSTVCVCAMALLTAVR